MQNRRRMAEVQSKTLLATIITMQTGPTRSGEEIRTLDTTGMNRVL